MKFFEYKDLKLSIIKLSQKGGSFTKAADKADALIGRIARKGKDPLHGFQKTNHGESRIKHCIKYDLSGRSRLVTVQTNGRCLLLFVGDHNATDKWLESNKGITFALNEQNKLEEVKNSSNLIGERDPIIANRLRQDKYLYEMLDETLFDRLTEGIPRAICRKLETLNCFDESKLLKLVKELDENINQCLFDVFLALIRGDIKGSERCARLYLGDITCIEDIDIDSVIVDSEFLKNISTKSDDYPKYLRKFAEESDFQEWMLYMHPDQEAIAFTDFNGPSKLLGVSGSGKTCVVIQRAIYLAKKYPGESILVVTLNKPLAALIKNLVMKLVEPELLSQIKVRPFFKVCQDLLRTFEPDNVKLYDDVTWKSGEHIDAVWREFYRCELGNNDASVLHELHDILISRKINAEHYINEEFDWIRSAFPKQERNNYLSIKRQGRTVPLTEKYRRQLLKGLAAWEKKMADVGVTDYLNISTVLYNHIDKINPEYRCVLIDESQDFGNIEFSIARKLVCENDNDIFLCGDAAQQISTKYQRPKEIGIDLHSSRSKKITRNYRNSREILELANDVLMQNLSEKMLESDDFEILEPEYASFSGSNPLLLKSANLEDEISSAITYVNSQLGENQKACICISGYSKREILVFANKIGFPALDGNIDISNEQVFISDLEQTKGFEFDYVCILNCADGIIPDPSVPEDEHFRELSRLYVAMTRAKLELILSYSSQKSDLFNESGDFFISDNWSLHVDENNKSYGQPEKLSEVVHVDDVITENPLEMAGNVFLYRKEAIALPSLSVDFIRSNVDGVGMVVMGQNKIKRRVKWRNLGDLFDDITNKPMSHHKISKNIVIELHALRVKMEEVSRTKH
ncbi:MAG: superfamily I DNA/RNA helicase [Cocleimonas sp.]|jgi:superfamily I DNA/RNA helicase